LCEPLLSIRPETLPESVHYGALRLCRKLDIEILLISTDL